MTECIFCKIARAELPVNPVYRDGEIMAIEDVNPQAPLHLLVMPLRHHGTIAELAKENSAITERMIEIAAKLGQERSGDAGFRLVINTGPDGGQTVDHVHVHVLAGRRMAWPPG
jgi:histidine triad (HIT) family protein